MSAELIAVSGIFTYDIYQTYVKPNESGRSLIYMAHCCVAGFGLFMAAFSTGLYYAGISMGYIYLMMGCIVSSAVLPAILTVMWKKQNWLPRP
jgi:Na+/proline symporter